MKTKKGDLSIQIIVIAILSLLVLGVVAYIFYDQIKAAAEDYTKKREQFTENPENPLGIQSDQSSNTLVVANSLQWNEKAIYL